jgi:hypothetical protein
MACILPSIPTSQRQGNYGPITALMQHACLTRPARRSGSRKEPVAACALHEAAQQDREPRQRPTLRIVYRCHAQVTRCVLSGRGYWLIQPSSSGGTYACLEMNSTGRRDFQENLLKMLRSHPVALGLQKKQLMNLCFWGPFHFGHQILGMDCVSSESHSCRCETIAAQAAIKFLVDW